jgi:hypothetical protein
VIEELDRSGLTHGTLLSPFQFVRVRTARESSGESRNRGKKSRLLPTSVRVQFYTRVRSLPAKRLTLGARAGQAQDPSGSRVLAENDAVRCLIWIRIVRKSAV